MNKFDELFDGIMSEYFDIANISKPSPTSRRMSQAFNMGSNPDSSNLTPRSNSLKPATAQKGNTNAANVKDTPGARTPIPSTEIVSLSKQYPQINFQNLKPGEKKQLGNTDAAIEVDENGMLFLTNVTDSQNG